ncbi:MAG: dynamin family protein [Bryobacteraceae bacterium]
MERAADHRVGAGGGRAEGAPDTTGQPLLPEKPVRAAWPDPLRTGAAETAVTGQPLAAAGPSGNDGDPGETLDLIASLICKYDLEALEDFLESCRRFAAERAMNVAILGRFKAGKSTFLNELLGRALLPTGVIPVTSVVTEIEYGERERAEVELLDGRRVAVNLEDLSGYVDESRNPGNRKNVARVRVWLPEMLRYQGIRFVDTPGMESVLAHNTDVSREWLPNVGLALVAVSVDPPLTQQDAGLIAELERYTPKIAVLLTKVDLLDEEGRRQVEQFVRRQLAARREGGLPVYPYSARRGFEACRHRIENELLGQLRREGTAQWRQILEHKVESLAGETAEYLMVALKAAERAESEREQLRRRVLGEKETLDDTRLGLELIVRHAMAASRTAIESRLRPEASAILRRLLEEFEENYPAWTSDLKTAMERFEEWLEGALRRELAAVSAAHRREFLELARRVSRQLSQSLQDFRNRLSEKVLETLGVPLKTSQMEIETAGPHDPDVRVGKVFDRNWELLSWAIPMAVFRALVRRHFRRKIERAVEISLARLTSQWNDVLAGVYGSLLTEAKRRLEALIHTVEQVLNTAGGQSEGLRKDLELIHQALSGGRGRAAERCAGSQPGSGSNRLEP